MTVYYKIHDNGKFFEVVIRDENNDTHTGFGYTMKEAYYEAHSTHRRFVRTMNDTYRDHTPQQATPADFYAARRQALPTWQPLTHGGTAHSDAANVYAESAWS